MLHLPKDHSHPYLPCFFWWVTSAGAWWAKVYLTHLVSLSSACFWLFCGELLDRNGAKLRSRKLQRLVHAWLWLGTGGSCGKANQSGPRLCYNFTLWEAPGYYSNKLCLWKPTSSHVYITVFFLKYLNPAGLHVFSGFKQLELLIKSICYKSLVQSLP